MIILHVFWTVRDMYIDVERRTNQLTVSRSTYLQLKENIKYNFHTVRVSSFDCEFKRLGHSMVIVSIMHLLPDAPPSSDKITLDSKLGWICNC